MTQSLITSSTAFTTPILDGVQHVLIKLPSVIFGVLVGSLLITFLTKFLKFILSYAIAQVGLRDVIVSIVRIFLWLFMAISVLNVFYPNVVIFFTGSLAAIGIAMAAGGSTLISDIIAGLFLARDADFNVGDEIIAGENQTRGVITGMDARRVRLKDDDDTLHIIPNSLIERKEWILVHRRSELSALGRATKVLKEAAAERAEARIAAATKRNVRLRKND